ncbi:hypothetical protein [Streptomyces sp. cmx-4-9]|uniref:hypothetical protein n=1 Tax=Streptomyces sp. cmx-4-9 TaxID=2790941 RepID=UPI00397FBEF5
MRPVREHRAPAALPRVVAAAGLAALAVGCAGSPGGGAAAPAGPGASSGAPSAAQAQDPDHAEVLAVYDRYWSALSAAYAQADVKGTALEEVASPSVYAQKEAELARLREGGHAVTGTTGHGHTSLAFSVEHREGQEVRTAQLTDCVDVSRWKAVERSTGREAPRPARPLLHYTAGVTFEKGPRGWTVVKDSLQKQEC